MIDESDKAPETPAETETKRSPFQYSIQALLVFTAVIAVLLAFVVVPWYHTFRETNRRNVCSSRIRSISQAIIDFESAKGHFPPAYLADENGKPIHSWRVLILPYLGEKELYRKYNFDEPWDGPNNRKLHSEIVSAFRCPSDIHSQASTMTSYVAVGGPETFWPGEKKLKRKDILDRIEETILVVEFSNSDIHWMEPRDLNFEEISMTINGKEKKSMSSEHRGIAHASFGDGAVRSVSDDIDPEVLRALLTASGRDGHFISTNCWQ